MKKIYELGNNEESNRAIDFVFIFNDKNTYHHLTDFKNEKAKELYKKVIAVNRALKDNAEQLEKLRNQWVKGDQKRKNELKGEILKLEDVRISLLNNVEQTENNVRKLESGLAK